MTTTNPSATNPEKAKFMASVASQNYKGPSVVDFINLSGGDSSPEARTKLASDYGVSGYNTGANNGDANTRLLNALRGTGNPATNANPGTTTPNPTNPGGTTIDPATTNADGTPKSATDIAFENYLKALTPTTEEQEAKKYVDRLVADSKLANERALNSGETMGFASGEAQRIGRNNNLAIDAARSAYDTTKSFRESRANVEKLKYEYNKGKIDKTEKDNAPFELSEGQSRYVYDPETKQYKVVASKAKTYSPKTTQPKAVTKAQEQRDAINNAVAEQLQIVKDGYGKGPRAGMDPEQVKILKADFQREFGSSAVAELLKAFANAGLTVDAVGDGVGYN